LILAARAERHGAKKEKRAKVESKLAEKIIALSQKKYAVIVADPESQFEFWSKKGCHSAWVRMLIGAATC
jgi:hypothetical protein